MSADRVGDVVRGVAQFSSLSADDRNEAHALIDAALVDRVAEARFGPIARRSGRVTVSIDDDGRVIEITPDGSRHRL